MGFSSWLRNRTASGSGQRRRQPAAAHDPAAFLPRLEALEDRWLPSISPLTVTNLHDSGPGSLRAAIAAANNGDTIKFARGLHGTIALTGGELLVHTGVTINGPGSDDLTISGNNSSRVFEISNNATVDIDHLTIANGKAVGSDGGAVLIDAASTLDIDCAVLTNNQAPANNGGVDGGSGGAIENLGSLTVTNSCFSNNVASLGSTVVGSNGGAIDSNGTSLTVSDTTFSYNQANSTATGESGGSGGAINSSDPTATVSDCTFDHNTASGRIGTGGAINYAASPAGLMTISHGTFDHNQAVGANGVNDLTAPHGGEALGGAVLNSAPLVIDDSAFTNNVAKGGDQGDNSSDGVDGGGFVGIATGGGVCNFFSTLTVSKSTFQSNKAIGGSSALGPGGDAAGGGVLGAGFATNTLSHVKFIDNQAVGGDGAPGSPGGSGFGGGFYNGIYSTAVLSHVKFVDNLARGGDGGSGAAGGDGGGGAFANGGGFGELVVAQIGAGPDNSSLTLDHARIKLNTARGGTGSTGGNGRGGGGYGGPATTLTLTHAQVTRNEADGGEEKGGGADGAGVGGGIYDLGALVIDSTSAVKKNHASTSNDDIFT